MAKMGIKESALFRKNLSIVKNERIKCFISSRGYSAVIKAKKGNQNTCEASWHSSQSFV
jgi:hypothetical protein